MRFCDRPEFGAPEGLSEREEAAFNMGAARMYLWWMEGASDNVITLGQAHLISNVIARTKQDSEICEAYLVLTKVSE